MLLSGLLGLPIIMIPCPAHPPARLPPAQLVRAVVAFSGPKQDVKLLVRADERGAPRPAACPSCTFPTRPCAHYTDPRVPRAQVNYCLNSSTPLALRPTVRARRAGAPSQSCRPSCHSPLNVFVFVGLPTNTQRTAKRIPLPPGFTCRCDVSC